MTTAGIPRRSLRLLPRLLLVAVALLSCNSESASGPTESTGADPAAPVTGELPPLKLTDETPDLLLTWVDDKGTFHVVQTIATVPELHRNAVRVVVTTSEEGTGSLVYVADLAEKRTDGTYGVKTMTRAQWDELGAQLRAKRMEALAPSASVSPPAPGPSAASKGGETKVSAIIYGADWCKPCHQAENFLKKLGVHVTKKDIEKSRTAAAEMKRALARANRGGASIPVIDLMGQLFVGYNPTTLERAVRAAQGGTAL